MSEDASIIESEVVESEEVETEEVAAEIESTSPEDSNEAIEEVEPEEAVEPDDSSSSKKVEDGVKKRIDELTKIRRETERDRDYWKNQAQRERVAPEPVQPGKTLSDFEYDEGKFAEYLTNTARAEATAEVERHMQDDRQSRAQADFSGKESDFASSVDDYHTVTRNNDLKITNEMVGTVMGSPQGPELLYYLGKNPGEAERLSKMPPLDMAREMGRLEATKLVKEKAPSVSKAPKPAPKLVTTSSTVSTDPAKMTDSQFRKWRQKAIANR